MLRFAYHFKPVEICSAFKRLLGLPNVQLTDSSLIAQTLQWHENGLDFADALHLTQSQSCASMYTFDQKFVTRARGLTECQVQAP